MSRMKWEDEGIELIKDPEEVMDKELKSPYYKRRKLFDRISLLYMVGLLGCVFLQGFIVLKLLYLCGGIALMLFTDIWIKKLGYKVILKRYASATIVGVVLLLIVLLIVNSL